MMSFRGWHPSEMAKEATIRTSRAARFLPRILRDAGWVLLAVAVVAIFFSEARELLHVVIKRVEYGGSISVGPVKLEAVPVANPTGSATQVPALVAGTADEAWRRERESYYGDELRRVGLVHRLYRSRVLGQRYDALIYIIPHKKAFLAGVSKVEYYFGSFWNDNVFVSDDRARGFPIVASAYGPFLCVAKVYFTDGSTKMLHRYIDFEMSDVAPLAPKPADE